LELSPDGVIEAAHQTSQRFFGALAGGEFAAVVVAAGCVVADLGDRSDVERVVQLAVPGPGRRRRTNSERCTTDPDVRQPSRARSPAWQPHRVLRGREPRTQGLRPSLAALSTDLRVFARRLPTTDHITPARTHRDATDLGAALRCPNRAPDNRVGDREPITDGGRVMWGPERVVDFNSAPAMQREVWG
jgi:hypothetical protein